MKLENLIIIVKAHCNNIIPAAIPFHERPSIVENVLPLALSYAATEPA